MATITGQLTNTDQLPAVTTITFSLTKMVQAGGVTVLPFRDVKTSSDAAGRFSIDLQPGCYKVYFSDSCVCVSRKSSTCIIKVPNTTATYNWTDLLDDECGCASGCLIIAPPASSAAPCAQGAVAIGTTDPINVRPVTCFFVDTATGDSYGEVYLNKTDGRLWVATGATPADWSGA